MRPQHVPVGLAKVAAALAEFDKCAARAPKLSLPRAAGYGALARIGMHAGNQLLSASSGMPTDPSDTATGAAARSAASGVVIEGLLNLLNRMIARR